MVGRLVNGIPSVTVGELLLELDRLSATHAQLMVETRRKMADLEELHDANRFITVATLTAGMAHELGTPLGVVLACAQRILTDHEDIAEARKDAAEIIHQVDRMSQAWPASLKPRSPPDGNADQQLVTDR